MFTHVRNALIPALLITCLAPTARAHTGADAASLLPLPIVSARLYISYAGNGYYLVVVDGQSSAANATVGVRVYGEDTWFDDFLFSMGVGTSRTDASGRFNLSRMVHRGTLNEDWEGQDEIYAVASVSGAGSARTQTIRQSF